MGLKTLLHRLWDRRQAPRRADDITQAEAKAAWVVLSSALMPDGDYDDVTYHNACEAMDKLYRIYRGMPFRKVA
jgi:hypothetical protein